MTDINELKDEELDQVNGGDDDDSEEPRCQYFNVDIAYGISCNYRGKGANQDAPYKYCRECCNGEDEN